MISEMSKEKQKWRKRQDQIQRNKYNVTSTVAHHRNTKIKVLICFSKGKSSIRKV